MPLYSHDSKLFKIKTSNSILSLEEIVLITDIKKDNSIFEFQIHIRTGSTLLVSSKNHELIKEEYTSLVNNWDKVKG